MAQSTDQSSELGHIDLIGNPLPSGPPTDEVRSVLTMSQRVFGDAQIRIEEDRETMEAFYVVDVV